MTKLDQILLNGNNVALVRARPLLRAAAHDSPQLAHRAGRHMEHRLAAWMRACFFTLCSHDFSNWQLVPGGSPE